MDFEGELFYWRGPAPFHFVRLPEDMCTELHGIAPEVSYGWGMIPVRARIGGTEWTTSLFPKDGGYLLPIKDAVRRAEGGLDSGAPAEIHLAVEARS